ncbi:DNA translocase FtsK [Thalassobacillus hwangdonensis]|uniref:DNA translocase FtsK n=1 Tax=Thalassobacillus hwangdonensis TaxID=546108 RepID=A0ABW3L242_9BACI
MKKKFKDLFNEEPSESKEIKSSDSKEVHDRYVNTKMTYRYPKQGEFRFPVIPDREKPAANESSGTEERTSRRRRPDKQVQETSNRKSRSESPVPTVNERKHERRQSRTSKEERGQRGEHQQKEELPATPFKPTEIPSPIYGFQQQQGSRRIDDVPSYLEKSPHVSEPDLYEVLKRMNAGRAKPEPKVEVPQTPVPEETQTEKAQIDAEVTHAPNEHNESEQDSPYESIADKLLKYRKSREAEADTEADTVDDGEAPSLLMEDTSDEDVRSEIQPSPSIETEQHKAFLETAATTEVYEEPEEQLDEQHELVHEADEDQQSSEEPVEELETQTENSYEENGVEESEEADELAPPVAENERQEVSDIEQPAPEKKRTGPRRVPFNVIMTPRDKRNTMQKEQRKQTQQQQKNNIPSEPVQRETAEKAYHTPPHHLLDDPVEKDDNDQSQVKEQMELLETTLKQFHVRAKVINAMRGPSVTRYEVQPEPGVKVSKITNLADDIKLSMAARDIRIEAPIPGKQAVGIEVPNVQSQMVGLQEIFESPTFKDDASPLTVALGLDIGGDPVVTNLKKMPHGLIAGATGSGKSVCINTILVSLLYKASHEDVKFLLIDPKMVELAPYNDLPHLVSPVITDVKAATTALKWAVKEMEERYEKFVEEGVRDVERYNQKMEKQQRNAEKLPYLVIVIDELADLMMVSPQDVEDAICRIAQKARACGIHLLLATQRPSVDVITGLIKANIPTRIAFSVSSQVDSRTIIDTSGAEKLLGRGDMLFVENGSGQSVRVQGAFVSDDEIERVTNYVKKQAPPNYLFEQEELLKQISSEQEEDELFMDAVQFVIEHNGASASLLQRRFKVGYNRAARLIDHMEEYGIISEQKGSKPRDILMNGHQVEELLNPKEASMR